MRVPLHYEGSLCSFHAPDLLSAIQNPAAVAAKITKELEAHRLAGPFSSPPFLVFGSLHSVWFLKKWRVSFD